MEIKQRNTISFFKKIGSMLKIIREKDKLMYISLIIFSILLLCSIIIPVVIPKWFTEGDSSLMLARPCLKRIFGGDGLGRDLFVRTLEACRISFGICFVATFITIIIGTTYGMIAGFYGGRVDSIMMKVVDGLYSLPFIFLTILFVAVFGRNFLLVFVAIACVSWLDIARIVRGQTLEIKNKEYISAAYLIGLTNMQIIFKHILRNLIGTVIIYATIAIPSILSLTSFLGFLGFGIQPPSAGLGELINEGCAYIQSKCWWLLFFPCLFLTTIMICLFFISNGIKKIIESKN